MDGSHVTGCDAELREGKENGGKDGYVARERNKHTEIGLWERSLSKGHAEASS